jgi:hypothetical protein
VHRTTGGKLGIRLCKHLKHFLNNARRLSRACFAQTSCLRLTTTESESAVTRTYDILRHMQKLAPRQSFHGLVQYQVSGIEIGELCF